MSAFRHRSSQPLPNLDALRELPYSFEIVNQETLHTSMKLAISPQR